MLEQKLLNSQETSAYLGVKESTLAMWRCNKIGPQYIKLGKKLIKYKQSDLDKFLSQHIVKTTLQKA